MVRRPPSCDLSGLPPSITWTTRLRKDAALYALPPARTGKRGRLRGEGRPARLPRRARLRHRVRAGHRHPLRQDRCHQRRRGHLPGRTQRHNYESRAQSGRRAFESRLTLVASPILCLLESPARRSFKDMAGQINHFLITILVGLAAVEHGTATLPPGMRTSWAPHNRTRSAARSREFAHRAFLAWLVDALDAYIRGLQSEPSVADANIMQGIERANIERANRAKEGLSGRLRVISAATEQLRTPEAILVEMAVVWRNRLVHQQATNRIGRLLIVAAHRHSEEFISLYRVLVIDDLIKHAERTPSAAPTLKEATAIVQATHKFVERCDGFLLQRLDIDSYFREMLRRYLISGDTSNPKALRIRAGNVWSRNSIDANRQSTAPFHEPFHA